MADRVKLACFALSFCSWMSVSSSSMHSGCCLCEHNWPSLAVGDAPVTPWAKARRSCETPMKLSWSSLIGRDTSCSRVNLPPSRPFGRTKCHVGAARPRSYTMPARHCDCTKLASLDKSPLRLAAWLAASGMHHRFANIRKMEILPTLPIGRRLRIQQTRDQHLYSIDQQPLLSCWATSCDLPKNPTDVELKPTVCGRCDGTAALPCFALKAGRGEGCARLPHSRRSALRRHSTGLKGIATCEM